MIDIHTRESELEVQIVGLQGMIEKLQKEIEDNKKEFLNDLQSIPQFKHIAMEYVADIRRKWEISK
ncbi:hypothetical protein LCGC14_1903940 [marine sediment metagenome]|uniref:Uncharacterized protein n=1 Tax=marine sediment metagenome TaxID=412755 RepID=A0A0F9ITU4_9ZZZZ